MRGHLQCRDTLAGNEGCPLKTGTTVAAETIQTQNEEFCCCIRNFSLQKNNATLKKLRYHVFKIAHEIEICIQNVV